MTKDEKKKKFLYCGGNRFKHSTRSPLHNPYKCFNSGGSGTEINDPPFESVESNDSKTTFMASYNIWGAFYGVIYMLTDVANKLVYIGQTIRSLRNRFRYHLKYPSNKFLKHAFDRYGYELKIQKITASKDQISTTNGEFVVNVIRRCKNSKELNEAEKEEIKRHKSCVKDYHIIVGGEIIPLYGYNVDRGGRRKYPTYGPEHPLYIRIEENILIELIKKGFFLTEIAKEFNVSANTISRRICDLWHEDGIRNLGDAREYFGGAELYNIRKNNKIKNAHHMQRILTNYQTFLDKDEFQDFLDNDLTADEIDEIVLPLLLNIGFSSSIIGEMVGLPESHAIASRYRDVLDMNYLEARDHYYFKPRIVTMLKDGLSTKDLYSFFNQNYNHHKAPKVKSGRVGISNAIRRIWNKEYDEFKCRAMDEGKWNKSTSPFDYNRLQFTHFYHYLIRIYHLYPKMNVELADLITESELSTKEVDKEFLIFLVQIGKGLGEIAEKYNSTYDVFRKWFKRVLGMNYNNAKDEYFWKPKLLPLIKKHDPINAMTNIAKKLNIPDTTIRQVIKRIWKDEFEQFGSLRTLLNYLKNS